MSAARQCYVRHEDGDLGQEPYQTLHEEMAERAISAQMRYSDDHTVPEDHESVMLAHGPESWGYVFIPDDMSLEQYREDFLAAVDTQDEETYRKIRANLWGDDLKAWAETLAGSALLGLGAAQTVVEGDPAFLEIAGGTYGIVNGWLLGLDAEYGPESKIDGVKTILTEGRLPSSEIYERAKEEVKEGFFVEETDVDVGYITEQLERDGISALDGDAVDEDALAVVEEALEHDVEGCRLVRAGVRLQERETESTLATLVERFSPGAA